jgi:NAD(P)-dependent dehydrogenase (short-subunit alcohol dehydrogenase family)
VQAEGIALVTGASRGIGRATALALARAGFDVVATMRDPSAGTALVDDAAAQSSRGSLRVDRLDVTDTDSIRLPDSLRVLVNNAGIEGDHPPLETTPLAMWRELVETNLIGVVEVTRRAIPLMRAAGGGVICNITSSSILAPMPFFAPYRATKAAVSALGESLRTELAPFGIRIVEIMPGPIDTDMYADSERPLAAIDDPAYRQLAEHVNALKAHSRAMLTPAEGAAAAIVAAILDEGGPLRHGCDPLSVGLLEQWRRVSDEELMSGYVSSFTVPQR